MVRTYGTSPVCPVFLASLMQPHKPDRLAGFFGILFEGVATENQKRMAEERRKLDALSIAIVVRWIR